MAANKRYGRQIILSLFLTVFIILGLLYLAARFLLPHVDVNQQQVYDVLIKVFPILLGLIMIEIGVLVARRRDEEIAEEADTLPPNAYDKPLHILPGDDPILLAQEDLGIGEPVVATVAPVVTEEPAVAEVLSEPVVEPVIEPSALVEEVVTEEPEPVLEAVVAPVMPEDEEPYVEPEVAAVEEPLIEEEFDEEEAIEDFVSVIAEAFEAYDEVEAVNEFAIDEYEYVDADEEPAMVDLDAYPFEAEEPLYHEETYEEEYTESEAYDFDELPAEEFLYEEETLTPATARLEEAIAQLTQTVLALDATIGGLQDLKLFAPPVAEELLVPDPVVEVVEPEPVVEAPPVVEPVAPVAAPVAVAEEDLIDMADFDAVLAYELETATEFAYDLTIAMITISEGPVARVVEKLINESTEFAFSFEYEDGRIAFILPFYNEEEARAFTLPLAESCEREYSPALLEIGFASRNGRSIEPALLVAEAERRIKSIS